MSTGTRLLTVGSSSIEACSLCSVPSVILKQELLSLLADGWFVLDMATIPRCDPPASAHGGSAIDQRSQTITGISFLGRHSLSALRVGHEDQESHWLSYSLMVGKRGGIGLWHVSRWSIVGGRIVAVWFWQFISRGLP